jgi:CRISPR-associated protein Csm1
VELKEDEVLLLGAFLHDIGKFVQRALANPQEKTHAQLGEEVIDKLLEFVSAKERVKKIVRGHHEEVEDELAKIVKEADHIAAGERTPRREPAHEKISESPLRQSLYFLDEKDKDINSAPMFPLKPLGPYEDNIFPVKPGGDRGHYGELWKDFADEANKLPKGSFNAFFLSLYHLLYKYTWCVPSAAFKDYPTISLFDHSRMTAAVAWCLYKGDKEKPFMFIKGDIGGIQNFIYSLASPDEAQEGMARRLRGRSFYLSLLTESAARLIMEKLRLPEPNLIWVGGGGFLLLAPNKGEETRRELREAIQEIESELLEKHHGQLSLAVAYCEASEKDMVKPVKDKTDDGRNFKALMKTLGEKLEDAKEKKFALQDKWPSLSPKGETECIVCAAPMKKEKEGNASICQDCQAQKKIGEDLPDSNYLLWVTDENRNPSDEPCAEILGQRWYLLKNPPANPPGNAVLYRTRGMDFLEGAKENDTLARGFRFVATHVPGTFEEMAKKAEGADYLAALRMDVDDMGYLLAKVPDEFQTPSFYASVSRLLDLFFSGYMNTMIRGDEALYIVYAGGDDLFIVGAWDKVLEKALEISEKFGKYTDNPESLHLSGGHYIFKPKFPIGRAAEGAGKAESRAKEEKRHKQESSGEKSETKNALCAFGEVFSWDKVKEALGFSDKLLEYMKDEKISRSFVQTLLDIYHRDYKDKRLIWAARVMYQLARNVPDELVAELEKELVRGNKMETAQLWANIALLKTREKP